MTYYKGLITKATNCTNEEAVEIEDHMRHIIFHSTLDWQSEETLIDAAKTAKSDLDWMKSDEGVKYMESLYA